MLAAVLAGSHEAVSCWERWLVGDVRLVTANDRFMALVRRTGQPVPVGAQLDDVVPQLPPGAAALLKHVMDTGDPFSMDGYAVGMPDGSVRRWDATLTPLTDTSRPTVVVSIVDATRRIRAEKRLAASAAAFDQLESRVAAGLGSMERLAGAVSAKSDVGDVMATMADGMRTAFGLDAVVAVPIEAEGTYEVRANTNDAGRAAVGTSYPRALVEGLLQPRFETCPNVFFVPHDEDHPAWGDLGPDVEDPADGGNGPQRWHPHDACFVRLRTARGRDLGVLALTPTEDQPRMTPWQFQALGMYAQIGSNVAQTLLLANEIGAKQTELEVTALRRELMDELLLHRHLVEIGSRVGGSQAASAQAEVFPLLAERLNEVLPIKSLTVNRVDQGSQTYRAIYHSDPGPAAAMLRFEAPIGAGTTGKAALDRTWVISNSGTDQPGIDVPGTPDEDEHLMAVPVLIDEQVRAVLTLRRAWHAPAFTPADARRAELFAQHVTAALLLVELAETGEELAASRKVLAEQVQKLESLNGLKDEFVANVSHELRTPLTAVLGILATLNRDIEIPDEVRAELLVRGERQARRLGDLLENLLAASRLAGEDPAVVTEDIDVRGLLQEIAATLRFRAPGRQVTLRVKGTPVISTDPTLLYRVLYNLGDNALKYSDGPVSLTARLTGGAVRIGVRDRGVGIAPEDLQKVFGRFQQLDQASARRVGGVGLGLYLSSRLARALGGRIDVASTPGEGSTFTLVLPVQPQMSLVDDAAREREADGLSA